VKLQFAEQRHGRVGMKDGSVWKSNCVFRVADGTKYLGNGWVKM